VRLLVERGADVNAKDKYGSTALYQADKGGHEAVVRLLVERGADVNAKDEWGSTALHHAARKGTRQWCGCWSSAERTSTRRTNMDRRCCTKQLEMGMRRWWGCWNQLESLDDTCCNDFMHLPNIIGPIDAVYPSSRTCLYLAVPAHFRFRRVSACPRQGSRWNGRRWRIVVAGEWEGNDVLHRGSKVYSVGLLPPTQLFYTS
jgi:hypothetical protein